MGGGANGKQMDPGVQDKMSRMLNDFQSSAGKAQAMQGGSRGNPLPNAMGSRLQSLAKGDPTSSSYGFSPQAVAEQNSNTQGEINKLSQDQQTQYNNQASQAMGQMYNKQQGSNPLAQKALAMGQRKMMNNKMKPMMKSAQDDQMNYYKNQLSQGMAQKFAR